MQPRILLALALCVTLTGRAVAQSDTLRPLSYGFLADPARHQLEQSWDDTTAMQVERGWCVASLTHEQREDFHDGHPIGMTSIVTVYTVIDPDSATEATPQSVHLWCSDTTAPLVHVHTPTTCNAAMTKCMLGGLVAFACEPSRADYEQLRHSGAEFGIIQCDRRAFRFYWPYEYHPN